MQSKKNTENELQTGDFFNETDDDQLWVVKAIYRSRNPPVVYCVTMKTEDSDEETEEEYSLQYVEKCVKHRKQFNEEGFASADVYEIYKMSLKKLRRGLRLAKQRTTGSLRELRKRMCFYRNITEIPEDVRSGTESDSSSCLADLVAVSSSSSSSEHEDSDSEYEPSAKETKSNSKKKNKKNK